VENDTQHIPASPFRLLILGDGSVRTIPLTGSRWVIGRSPECTIPVRDPTVSRRHVEIERQGDSFLFRDLGGSNPIALDGRPASQGILEPGHSLTIGLTRLILERRNRPAHLVNDAAACVVQAREVIDDEAPGSGAAKTAVTMARRVLERIEWTFADLGSLADAAEPLLDLGLNLTGRRRGLIGRFTPQGGLETLATLDTVGHGKEVFLPAQVLVEVQQLGRPVLLTTHDHGQHCHRLVLPLGHGPEGVMILEDPLPEAPQSQELLRLGSALAVVVWHRLQEVRERLALRDEVQRLRFRGTTAHNALLASTRLQPALQRLREFANLDGAVLLFGEDGTEREDLARYLHFESGRRKEPFVSVNLAATPAARHAKVLFGDDAGDQTSAITRAEGGTLFVDGVQLLPVPLQDRLAQAMLGAPPDDAANGSPRPRLVLGAEQPAARAPSAWSTQLAGAVEPAQLAIPPLRDEPRDVLALAELFLADLGSGPDGAPRLLSERTKRLLTAYAWPGNVRQLRYVVEAAAGCAGSQPIMPRHLPREIAEPTDGVDLPAISTLEAVERRHILEVLQRMGGSRTRTAAALGIALSTLHLKLKSYADES
jgi:DNA-binding NtrC family response regulator/pSer/pThr/pTyr-binding forkhead associated (FHA) protein